MIPAIIVVGIIAVDQLTKLLVRSNLALGESIPVLGDFVRFLYVRNTGTAFSMFENNKLITLGLTTILVVVCLLFLVYEYKKGHILSACCAALIVGGGIGNLIDRVVLGYVTDMISVGNFAIFNVADMGVTCGCVLLLLCVLFTKEGREDE